MFYIAVGCIGFLFFYLFDWNKIQFIHRWLNACFAVGILLLIYASIGILRSAQAQFELPFIARLFFGLLATLSLALQFYVLFFALPFKNTYLNDGKKQIVISNGVYGLCRHPGVLFFFFFFIFLWLTAGAHQILLAGLIWTAMDVLHVYVQDRWMFPKSLINYELYQEKTPFLLPDRKSFRNISPSGKVRSYES